MGFGLMATPVLAADTLRFEPSRRERPLLPPPSPPQKGRGD